MHRNFSVEWAREAMSKAMLDWSRALQVKGRPPAAGRGQGLRGGVRRARRGRPGRVHWSRVFEYPWVMENGDFKAGQLILDAAGGDGPIQAEVADLGCHVVNMDVDADRFPTKPDRRVLLMTGDIRDMHFFPDGVFQRVLCVSVLEHVEKPLKAVSELWRVLAPGGRLVVTYDVASYSRWNHTIDLSVAKRIMRFFGKQLPPEPPDVLSHVFPEWHPKPREPSDVKLKVVCFKCDKA